MNPTTTASTSRLRPGDRFAHRGQEYTLLAFQRERAPAGLKLLLQTNCADCGAPFRMAVSRHWHADGILRRRCDAHKTPPWTRPTQASKIRSWRADDAPRLPRAYR